MALIKRGSRVEGKGEGQGFFFLVFQILIKLKPF